MDKENDHSAPLLQQGKTEMEKISVIVPVYNCEKYIGTCIESIREQTYENIEIILVNDGSKDRSGEICRSYVEKDRRIKYMEQ